jgi:hypothetical protein
MCECERQGWAAAESPRSVGRPRRVPGQIAAYSPRNELVEYGVAPLLENVAPEPSFDPLLQFLECSLRLTEPEVCLPAEQVLP